MKRLAAFLLLLLAGVLVLWLAGGEDPGVIANVTGDPFTTPGTSRTP